MKRPPTFVTGILVALVALATTVTVLAAGRGSEPSSAAAPAPAPAASRAAVDPIAKATAAVAADPRSAPALAGLAGASLARFRDTGDPSWNTRGARAAARALRRDPRSFDALDALGSVALTRHRFRDGLRWAARSLRVAPDRVAPVGIRADALIELGRYREGFAAVERRVGLLPDLPSYSRASYVRELIGDRPGAITLMGLAVEAGGFGSESRAWSRVQLGLLRLGGGDLAGAEREMRTALQERPKDPRATAGLARVLAARGRLDEAAVLYGVAIDRLPLPEYPAALAEIELARGDPAAAREQLALVGAMQQLLRANGSAVDLDLALIEADFGRPDAADIARARRARAARPGVIGDQILGWVLTRAGRCDEGYRLARRSLRLGTRDALMRFHAGMAARCAGDRPAARRLLGEALRLSPDFSVRWAPVARRALSELGG